MRFSQSTVAVDHGQERRHLRRHEVVAGVGAAPERAAPKVSVQRHAVLQRKEDRDYHGVRLGGRGDNGRRLAPRVGGRGSDREEKERQPAEPPRPRTGSEASRAPDRRPESSLGGCARRLFLAAGSCRGHISPTCLRDLALRRQAGYCSSRFAAPALQDRAQHIGYFGKFGHSNKPRHQEEDDDAHRRHPPPPGAHCRR